MPFSQHTHAKRLSFLLSPLPSTLSPPPLPASTKGWKSTHLVMLLHAIRSSGSTLGSGSCLRASSLSQARSGRQINLLQRTSSPRPPNQTQTLSTRPPSSTGKDAANPHLNIRQRKSGSWLPRWQTVTLSNDDPSTPGSFRCSLNKTRSKDDPEEQEEIAATKFLLSPQNALGVFLPKGYPESVTPNYWAFTKWQFVHNVAGSVTAGSRGKSDRSCFQVDSWARQVT